MTLTGPGGTGKTRLSIQVAAEVEGGVNGAFADGIWFIPLAPVKSAQGIISAIAQGLNFTFYKGEEPPRQQLLSYLHEKYLLLVLDNFEHLLDGGRELVSDILAATSGVKLLVTSRERLNLQAEQIYLVRGLSIPDSIELSKWEYPEEKAQTYSGIQLLAQRAQRVKPEFQITRANLKSVIEICQLVDGSPLGIELAAAWLEVLPEEEIAKEIVRSLDFLESTAVDTPERQRSLRMVFDTSWRLLNSAEQQTFRRLCIFRGSFTRQAAEAISMASLRSLLSLANKSWLQQNQDGRFQLHEVLKQYGLERLYAEPGEWRETKEREAEFFCKLLEQQGQALLTSKQIQALEMLKPEMDSNIPDAWEWLVEQGRISDLISRILPWVFHYWLIRGALQEDIPFVKKALDAVPDIEEHEIILQRAILETVATNIEMNLFVYDDHPKERLKQLWTSVHKHRLQDELGLWYTVLTTTYGAYINYQEGSKHLGELAEKATKMKDTWESANSYLFAGLFSVFNQLDISERYLLRALDIFKSLGVVHEQGTTLHALGNLAGSQMNYEKAIEYNLAAQTLYEQVGDALGIDSTWTNLGEYYIYLGKIEQALHAFEELRHYSEKTGRRRTLGNDLSWESLQVSRYGELDMALELRQRSLEIAEETGNQHDIAWASWEMGEIYRLMGNLDMAERYYRVAQPSFEMMQEFIGMGFYHRGLGDIAAMQGDWEQAKKQYLEALMYHEKEERGNRGWGLALTNARMGIALVETRQLEDARQYLKTSLAQAVSWKFPDLKALPLAGIARWLAVNGLTQRAVELAACVASKPTTWNEIKYQARTVLEGAKITLLADESRRWEETGAKMKIDEACDKYGDKGGF